MLNIINSILLIFGDAKKSLILGLVAGLIIGLIIGWGIWPAEWTDAAPVDLSVKYQYQQRYLHLLAEYYAIDPSRDLRAYLGERWTPAQAAKAVDEMIKDPKWSASRPLLQNLSAALKAMPEPQPPKKGGLSLPVCLGLVVFVLVLGGGGLLIWRRLSGRPPAAEPGVITPVERARASQPVAPTAWVGVAEKPVSQFVTTYELGDNRYDLSFSIESGADFLGECGAAISETIGVGDPDKVTALEVWLFDKNDIRTVTKVLMSEYCYNDATLRAKLAPKGEAVLIAPNASVELDTQTLKLRARVVELEYGSDGLPPQSFFNKVTLELAVWPKTA